MARGSTSKGRRPSDGRHHRPARKPTLADCKGPKPTISDVPIAAKRSNRQSRLGFADRATPGERIEFMKRASSAVELRIMGASFQEVADELGYASRGAAFDAYKKGYAALTDEIRSEAAEAVKHQLARNIMYRKRILIQANASGDQIAGSMAALQIDKFDSALRGIQPGAAANLDAIPIAGPAGAAAGVCAKCGSPATASLTDPKYEYERIEVINKILIESGVASVPLKPADDAGWDDKAEAAPLPAQTATPKIPAGSGVRFARISDRETRDLVTHDFRDNEIL
jgi:hypothetical protein